MFYVGDKLNCDFWYSFKSVENLFYLCIIKYIFYIKCKGQKVIMEAVIPAERTKNINIWRLFLISHK